MSGNPLGRPRGSRNKLSEDFIRALADDFERHGAQAIADVRERKPEHYLKAICAIMPKGLELDIEVGPSPELRMELSKFIEDYRLVRETMGRLGVSPRFIEAVEEEAVDGE